MRKVSAVNVFVLTLMFAYLTLFLAPAVGTRGPYSSVEQALVVVASNWVFVLVYCVSAALLTTVLFLGFRAYGIRRREENR